MEEKSKGSENIDILLLSAVSAGLYNSELELISSEIAENTEEAEKVRKAVLENRAERIFYMQISLKTGTAMYGLARIGSNYYLGVVELDESDMPIKDVIYKVHLDSKAKEFFDQIGEELK